MRSRNYPNTTKSPSVLLLILASLLVTLVLAACGDATATTGPAAQPATTTPNTNTTVPSTTGSAKTTVPATTAPVTTTTTTKPANSVTPTATPGATPGATGPVSLGNPFYLKIDQTASLSNPSVTVRFIRISEDSRCPGSNGNKMVACAWSGQVSAVLEVKQGSNPAETITLTSFGGNSPKLPAMAVKNFGSFQLQLLGVEPHPIIDEQINPADYVATLQVINAPAQTVPTTTNPAPPVTASPDPTTKTNSQTPAGTRSAPDVQVGPVSLNQPFSLKVGQFAVPSGTNLKLKFTQISEDSRCPDANPQTGKSVECFWAGQVTADIEVSENGRTSKTIKLTLPGSVNTQTTSKASVGNYQIEVKEILPRQVLDVAIDPANYTVTLVVSQ